MPIRQQRLHSIEYTNLKNLSSLNISFEPHSVTGIFGVNGSGKSTIIHSLLCLYKPSDQDSNRDDYKFSQFFTPTTHSKWVGSQFKIKHTYRQETNLYSNADREYSKTTVRWKPRYENRPERNVYFIGIKTCVPEIEIETSKTHINLSTVNLDDQLSQEVMQNAAYVLNRSYQEYNQHGFTGKRKKFLGVKCNDVSYSSLSMGAGEQRVFKILDTVFRAERYSLIIVDEIDLLLHTEALNRLINVIIRRANDKNLQIVFTSHRENLTQRDDINIRHIHQTDNQTICFNQSTPDCITRLTGSQTRPLELFVEDDLAEAIVQKIIEEQNIIRHCSIKRFGAIDNSFTLAAGMYIKGENLDNISIILDGDRYNTEQERLVQMEKFFSGTEQSATQRRLAAISCLKKFILPSSTSPEAFINGTLRSFADNSEVVNAAADINAVMDKHDFVNKIIDSLGYQDKMIGLTKVVNKLSTSENWEAYTKEVREWLNNRSLALHLN